MRSSWIWWGPTSESGILVSRGTLGHRNRVTGRMPFHVGGRAWSEVAAGQGCQGLSQPVGASRQSWNGFPLIASRKNQLCQDLEFELVASGSMKEKKIAVVQSQQFVVLCYESPRKLPQRVMLRSVLSSINLASVTLLPRIDIMET